MRWWRAGMRRQMWLYAAVCLAAAVAVLAVAQVVAAQARASGRELSEQLVPAATSNNELITLMAAQRSALRDYVMPPPVTAREPVLKAAQVAAREATREAARRTYLQLAAEIPGRAGKLQRAVRGQPAVQRRLDALLATHRDWVNQSADRQLAMMAAGDETGAADLQAGDGVRLGLAVQARGLLVGSEIVVAQSAAVNRVQQQQRALLAALVTSLVLVTAMVIGTYVALRRNVLTPFLAIGRAVDRIAAGDHELSVPAAGPLELAALGASVETMRVRLTAALTEREATELRYRQLLERYPDAAVQIAEDGLIVSINDQAERLFGYPREELIGRPLEVLVPEGLRERHQAHRSAYVADARFRPMGEGRSRAGRHRDGRSIPVEITLSAIRTAQGVLVSAAVRDISERLAAQAERERLIAEAEQERYERRLVQTQRLESLGQLVGGVAHDFNNLLNIILGYSGFVTKQLQEPPGSGSWEATREDVEQIHDAAQRASRLTHQLLAFGRREVIKPEVVNLNDVITGLEQLLRRTVGEHIDLVTSLDPELWMVRADPGQLEQVLVNLTVNARDAMPAGGKLTVDTSNVDVDAAFANSRPGLEPSRYTRLRVSDTGTGMDKETMRRVFEPFFTTKPKGQGTGLGLATVYGIITQVGGHPQLYSEVGFGTTFSALLPATDELEAFAERAAARVAPSRGETVLVVEDEVPLRELVARILGNCHYQVLVADDPAHALELAGDLGQRVDLLLTDVVMPGMLGKELAARIGELRPGLPVLYMSGYAYQVLDSQGTLDPGVELLEKPFTEQDLMSRLRNLLDRP